MLRATNLSTDCCLPARRALLPGMVLAAILMLNGCATPQRMGPVVQSGPAVPSTEMVAPVMPGITMPPPPVRIPSPLPDTVGPAIVLQDSRLPLLQAWVGQQRRLYQVAAPILMKNTELCPLQARKILGFTAKNAYSFSSDFVEVAKSGLGLGERLQIMSVLPESGAELAGIRSGDILLAAGPHLLARGPDAEYAAGSAIGDAVQGNTALDITVLRSGDNESSIIDVPLTPACAMVIDLGNTDVVNSYADGRRLMVTRGMLDFVRSDDELAAVLAREIAFNVINVLPRPDLSAVIDRLHTLDAVPNVMPEGETLLQSSLLQDAAVDRLALYMLARAGYPVAAARTFWERLAAAYPADMPNSHAALHAPIGERLAVIDRIIAVIATKRQNGQPLVP